MRRKEFSMEESEEEIAAFLNEASYGILAQTGEDGLPKLKPINYVYHRGFIYMHGAHAGEKMKLLRGNGRAAFHVSKEYALLPSYWSDPEFACPATTYFKSVNMEGVLEEVRDLEEKAEALEAFMRKLQPEGGYVPISTDYAPYVPKLKGVAVIRFTPERTVAKFKFGQNLQPEQREDIRAKLLERGGPLDAETAALMAAYCPFHRTEPT
ncbi:pyridoxamine 5'-phosphate oxidase family protein [Paenibacillus thermoaerophilus]|nr:pyridoxamine 5'-phosphate oxidase family protein [Paenibacillus thermoaerophilus]TMV17800.1 pyridoxamine 5'-phosphate oxidase family protein [Paenibacillus thermoaerophilus]